MKVVVNILSTSDRYFTLARAERLELSLTLLESVVLPITPNSYIAHFRKSLRPAIELPRQGHLEFLIFIFRPKKKLENLDALNTTDYRSRPSHLLLNNALCLYNVCIKQAK